MYRCSTQAFFAFQGIGSLKRPIDFEHPRAVFDSVAAGSEMTAGNDRPR